MISPSVFNSELVWSPLMPTLLRFKFRTPYIFIFFFYLIILFR
ncbi:hypothetical protein NC651_003430 [Populus alba x Populus x berolinensis]|nr:hypothetical protein NC651_003430 [Populus alba x Populus x berolinensis]